MSGPLGISGHAIQQQTRGRGPHLVSGLVNGCQGRIGHLRQFQVVEADDGNVVGAAESSFPNGNHHTQGNHVVGSEDGSRTWKHPQQNATLSVSSGLIEAGFVRIFRCQTQPGFQDSPLEPGEPLLGIGEV